jgi:acetyltransferase-like isoleucine patch superfamily enzyme
MGDHVSATRVRFETHDGGVWVGKNSYPELDVVKPIKIGNNVFIGFGSIIMPGVTIGNNVVIGAHSVVSKDIQSNVVAAGVPAKVIRPINEYIGKCFNNGDNTKKMSYNAKKSYFINKYSK